MKQVLITGAAGFIGYHLARTLAAQSDTKVVLVDNLQRGGGFDAELQELMLLPNILFLGYDLTERLSWHMLEQVSCGLHDGFDEVYHLAAVNGTKHFYARPHDVLRTNTLTLIHALDWIATLKKKPRLLFTSSNEAYAGALSAFGQLPIPTPEDVPLVVDNPYNARWSYGGTKLIGEQFVIHYAAAHQIPSVIVRPHNFYGPRAGYDHVIPELIERIVAQHDPFRLVGHRETRSFCYIDDAIDAMIRAMTHATPAAPTLHIGSEVETQIGDLAGHLFKIGGWSPAQLAYDASLKGSVSRRLADTTRIHELTGWIATTPLEVGLRKTFDWYRAHPRPVAS